MQLLHVIKFDLFEKKNNKKQNNKNLLIVLLISQTLGEVHIEAAIALSCAQREYRLVESSGLEPSGLEALWVSVSQRRRSWLKVLVQVAVRERMLLMLLILQLLLLLHAWL